VDFIADVAHPAVGHASRSDRFGVEHELERAARDSVRVYDLSEWEQVCSIAAPALERTCFVYGHVFGNAACQPVRHALTVACSKVSEIAHGIHAILRFGPEELGRPLFETY
jgi:hypothetical protein